MLENETNACDNPSSFEISGQLLKTGSEIRLLTVAAMTQTSSLPKSCFHGHRIRSLVLRKSSINEMLRARAMVKTAPWSCSLTVSLGWTVRCLLAISAGYARRHARRSRMESSVGDPEGPYVTTSWLRRGVDDQEPFQASWLVIVHCVHPVLYLLRSCLPPAQHLLANEGRTGSAWT